MTDEILRPFNITNIYLILSGYNNFLSSQADFIRNFSPSPEKPPAGPLRAGSVLGSFQVGGSWRNGKKLMKVEETAGSGEKLVEEGETLGS